MGERWWVSNGQAAFAHLASAAPAPHVRVSSEFIAPCATDQSTPGPDSLVVVRPPAVLGSTGFAAGVTPDPCELTLAPFGPQVQQKKRGRYTSYKKSLQSHEIFCRG